jgi:FtsP/CotA-like multicopper oxidase with cupredoxin domain
MRPTRRQLLKGGVVAGAAVALGGPQLLARGSRAVAATIDPTTIQQFVTPLFVLPAMPLSGSTSNYDQWSLAARPFSQQMLPAGMPATKVLGFGSTTASGTFHTPSYTIEARTNRQTRLTWCNQLVDSSGNYYPPLLPIDPTLHWANPPGGTSGRDSHPVFTSTPGPYTGPLPLVVHLHGAHDYEDADGYPEAWYLPVARNIPAGYATVGSYYQQFKEEAQQRAGVVWAPGSATFVFDNDQRATNLWFHDHSLGMTRTSVHSGLLGYYLLRGGSSDLPPGVLPGPAPKVGDKPGTSYYELPLVFQDPTFNADGSLFFPSANTASPGPYAPTTDIPPIWNAVFTGSTIVVNGNTWPYLNVEPRRYRFRLLNGCNVRPMTLKVVSDPSGTPPQEVALPIWVIGSDGGFLPAPQVLQGTTGLPILQSERYDVIIDFTGLTPGTNLYLTNEGGGAAVGTTGSVMQFRVVPLKSTDTSVPPDQLSLPGYVALGAATNTRQVSFNMLASTYQPSVTANLFLGGTVNADGTPNPLDWSAPMTETPAYGSTEIWEVYNFAAGGHDFHVHLVEFQIQNRQPIAGGAVIPPSVWETGDKDSCTAPPGQITRIKAHFDHRSRFVWHCHFLDHEDNGMMRPYQVV